MSFRKPDPWDVLRVVLPTIALLYLLYLYSKSAYSLLVP